MEADHQVTQPVWKPCCVALLLLVSLFAAGHASAHPSHSSYAEIEWSATGTLDVALRVVPEDLERALTLEARKSTLLVDTPQVRTLLERYLREHIQLLNPEPVQAAELLGLELDYRETWIYFSLPVGNDRPTTLRNTLLMDVEPTQTNRVRRLWAPDAPVLVFSTAEPQRDLGVSQESE